MKKITPKQELFCQNMASGLSQADAYRAAYNSGGMKAATIQNKAYGLMKRGEVRARVDEIKKQLEAKLLWTREESVEALKGVLQNPDRAGDITAAVKELNIMHGFNAPTQINLSGSVSTPELNIIVNGVAGGSNTTPTTV